MITFVGRRILQSVPLLLVISLMVFALIHAAPGGPLATYLDNPNVRPADIERLKHAMGLDRSLGVQYVSWLGAFVRGDWGFSYADGRPVLDRLLERVPATFELIATSSLLALIAALVIGVRAAQSRRFDTISSPFAVAGVSLPVFWFALLLQLLFAGALGWLPSSGRASFDGGGFADRLSHLVLPATVLAAVHAAAWSRYVRRTVREVIDLPFVRTARARGVTERGIMLRHALPNALSPFVAVVLLDASIMASGAVVTESVFAWPGVGSLFTESLAKRDYTVLMAFLMCGAIAVTILNLVADVAMHAIDPRTREAS